MVAGRDHRHYGNFLAHRDRALVVRMCGHRRNHCNQPVSQRGRLFLYRAVCPWSAHGCCRTSGGAGITANPTRSSHLRRGRDVQEHPTGLGFGSDRRVWRRPGRGMTRPPPFNTSARRSRLRRALSQALASIMREFAESDLRERQELAVRQERRRGVGPMAAAAGAGRSRPRCSVR